MKNIIYLAAIIGICSCHSKETSQQRPNDDANFERFKNYFVEKLWQIHPDWASSIGYHQYDSLLENYSSKQLTEKLAAYQVLEDSLTRYDEQRLSSGNKTALWMMRDQVKSFKWYATVFKSHEWNPATYNAGSPFALILNGTYAPLDHRLRAMNGKLTRITEYYAVAPENIKNPTIEHTELAILQNEGALSVFGEAMMDSVKKSTLNETEKKQLTERVEEAKKSISGYITWLNELKKTLKPETARSFRIGKELFEKKFEADIPSSYTAEQIYQKANTRKKELHREMAKLSRQLWHGYFGDKPAPADTLAMIKKMIDTLSVIHVHRDSFMTAIEHQLPELVKFITDKNLIYLDPSKPLVVRKTPGYQDGGGAGASIDAPGPYDKNANTYYNVSPLTGYTPERAESYLREYNKYILQILNIHEAIPGHYTQLVYSNNSPDMVKSILGNGAMIEGWAVYGERMMLENGYGNNEPEMWLMYYKWHLRSVCNTILDYSVHVLNMSKEDAIQLLTKEAFQQEAEAQNKWRRVSLSQVQLCSYFTGFSEIFDLREELKTKAGQNFNLKQFHEKFLGYGSAPVKYIRQLMIEE